MGEVSLPKVKLPAFLNAPGKTSSLIATFEWDATSVGPIKSWPSSLKAIIGFMVRSPVPLVLLWGEDGTMIYNDAYAVFAHGYEKLGMKVRDGWPEVADFNDNVLKTGLAGGTLSYSDQELTLTRSGKSEPVWMNLDYSPVLDDNGVPAGVMAIVVETTAKVMADRRSADEQARQQRLLAQMPGFVGVVSGPEHVYQYVNDAYVRISERQDFVGRKFREVFSDLEDQAFASLLDQAYSTGETFVARNMEIRLHGSVEAQWIDFVFEPIRDQAGSVTGVFIGGYEVTEAQRATAALRESEARLRALNADLERQVIERTQARGRTWQVTPDLMGALNSDGFFETSNPAWQTVLGWTEEELPSISIFDLLHPDDVERSREAFALNQQGQPAIRFPNRYRCKDGGYRWISWVGVPEDGMVYCTGRDITEAKLAEEELGLAQEALRQAQKMEAVGQLTGGIAHDFNNLLMGISGSLELLDRHIADGRTDRIARYIDAAQTSSRRAASLTQRLLAFSRRQTLDPKPVDANRLIGGMEELLRRTVGPAIAMEVVGAGGLWLVEVDASQLESALLNLVINARDAMPDGGRITIETANKWLDARGGKERDLPPGQYISLCVTDTGTGMTQDVIDRAFDPFYTTKPLGQGTGLGLSMIHGFVRQSGGQVRIYSEEGEGTTMCLYLPRFVGELPDIQNGDLSAVDAGHGETVLVIDDEQAVRMLVIDVLELAGYRVLEADDGPSGLKILHSAARIDLLITDVGLPGGFNGRQVADSARVSRPELKVLFITGYAENAVVGNGHLDPGMAVMTKPFTITELGARITEMLENREPGFEWKAAR